MSSTSKKSLFSQEAMDKLRTPEKLDTLLHVTNPLGWMAIISIMIMLIGVVVWSFIGSFTITTSGMGMIMDYSGIIAVKHTGSGKIEDIRISQGRPVKAGELLMVLSNPAQNAETSAAENNMKLSRSVNEASSHAADYSAKVQQKEANNKVFSRYDGLVEEVPVRIGDVVSPGDVLCTIRLNDDTTDLSGVLYVPVDQSKRIKNGMTIQLTPSGVNTSKTGSLIGIVRSVSEYPVNLASVQRTLANDNLPQQITQSLKSALVEVRFDLVPDENDKSGYLWTSTVGNHYPITPGSFVNGIIVVDRQPPIKRVFSKLSEWLRNR